METRNCRKPKQEMGVEGLPANEDHAHEILRSLRDVSPAHYTLKFESFSLFLNTMKSDNYESGTFEAGGYKWKLCLYPKGNKKRNVNGHISLYLAVADTKTIPPGWELNVHFKLFVFDHIRDKYLTVQDAEGGVRRFHRLKTEWGFDQLLPLHTFNDASNGYLVDDCCVFGAEVFVIKNNGKGECVSTMKDPLNNIYTWKINKVSAIDMGAIRSEEFVIGGHKWKIVFYPKGNGTANGKCVSLFLETADFLTFPPEWKVFAEYKLRIKRDQILGTHCEDEVSNRFCASSKCYGFPDFMPLSEFNDASTGYVVNDTVVIEAQITYISSFMDF